MGPRAGFCGGGGPVSVSGFVTSSSSLQRPTPVCAPTPPPPPPPSPPTPAATLMLIQGWSNSDVPRLSGGLGAFSHNAAMSRASSGLAPPSGHAGTHFGRGGGGSGGGGGGAAVSRARRSSPSRFVIAWHTTRVSLLAVVNARLFGYFFLMIIGARHSHSTTPDPTRPPSPSSYQRGDTRARVLNVVSLLFDPLRRGAASVCGKGV